MLPQETQFFISFHENDENRVLPVLEKMRKNGWKNIVTQQDDDAVSAAELIQKSEIVLVFLSKVYARDDVLMLEHFGYTAVIARKPFLPLWLDSLPDIQSACQKTLSGLTGGELSERSQILSSLEMLTAKHPGTNTETAVQALERFTVDKPFYTPSTPRICEKPCEAYEGEKPYLFISYARNDAKAVYPVVKELYESGWDLWYDEGIKTTQRYLPVIADHVKRCAAFVLMLSPRCLERPFVMNYELEFALRRGIPVIPVLLREITDIPDYITGEAAALIEAAVKPEIVCPAVEKTGLLVNRGPRDAVPPEVKSNVVYDICPPPELPGYEIAVAGGRITIIKYIGSDTEVVVPGEVVAADGTRFPVVGLRNAFQDCEILTSIILSGGITDIEGSEFSGCMNLTSVTLPDGVTNIKDSAFSGCTSLASIEIPDSVTDIGWQAFYGCTSLDSIEIPDSVRDIGWEMFSGCTSLRSITLPDNLTNIGNRVFAGCTNLASIKIPDGAIKIGWEAFLGCTSLTSIEIPDSVTDIGYKAFFGCTSLASIKIPDGVTWIENNMFSDCVNLSSVTLPDSITLIAWEAFSGCTNLVIHCSTGSYAEQYAKKNNLKVSYLNERPKTSVQNIPTKKNNQVHTGREKKTNVRLSNKLPFCGETPYALVCCADEDIHEASGILTGLYWEGFSIRYDEMADENTVAGSACVLAFFTEHTEQSEGAMRLLRLAINRDKAKIVQVFLDSSSWPKAVRNDLHDRQAINKSQMSLFAFEGKLRDALRTFGCSLSYPRGFEVSINEDKHATITNFTAKDDFPHIVIPNAFFNPPIEVSEIGNSAFDSCTNLISIKIPDSVTSIGEDAFRNSNLTSITLPEGVKSIGERAFCNSNLSSITLPDGVTSIRKNTFADCGNLTSIILPGSVKSIGDYAFEYTNLTSIKIPDGVTSIGRGVFDGCRKLRSISVDANHPAYRDDDGILFNKTGNVLIAYPAGKSGKRYTIPDGVTIVADHAFYGSNLISIILPDSVTSIGEDAFSYCKSLTSIALPDGVTSIGKDAFSYCKSLTSITLPDSLTSIGEDAFCFCENLTSITLPDGIMTVAAGVFRLCISLTSIAIPDSVTFIGNNAFENCGSMVIYCSAGSYAEKYAKENGIKCSNGPQGSFVEDEQAPGKEDPGTTVTDDNFDEIFKIVSKVMANTVLPALEELKKEDYSPIIRMIDRRLSMDNKREEETDGEEGHETE